MSNIYSIFQLKKYDPLYQSKLKKSIHKLYEVKDTHFFNVNLNLFSNIKLEYKTFNHSRQLIKLLKNKKNIDVNGKIITSLIRYKHKQYIKDIFLKECFITDMHALLLERNTKQNIYKKYLCQDNLYNLNNTSNIELLLTFLTSKLVEKNVSPHFPFFYGFSQTIFKKHTVNITEEYEQDILDNIKKDPLNDIQFKIIKKNNEVYLETYNIPVLLIATEKLDGDLLNYIHDKEDNEEDISNGEWLSFIFQIIAALTIIQKYFNACHNDLHTSNIMFSYTEQKYIYYEYKKKIYKVPTYGKILKIIDWGRSSYNFNNFEGKNNVYNSNGPTFGQNIYNRINLQNKKTIPYNLAADLSLFISNLIENDTFPKKGMIYNYAKSLLKDKQGDIFYHDEFDFNFYIDCSKYSHKGIPTKQIENKLFKEFTISKKKTKEHKKDKSICIFSLD
jgi:hypothetical protein